MNNQFHSSLIFRIDAFLLVLILFFLMLVCIAIGSAWSKKQQSKSEYYENPANNTIYGAVFALLAFILAFTFGMSGNRFDARRQATIQEANAIGTAILRTGLYPDPDRAIFRSAIKNYLQARIDYLTAGIDIPKQVKADKQASFYASALWDHALQFSQKNPSVVISGQMIPALNDMFDDATTNTYNELMRVPDSIVIMLFILMLICAFFIGYISEGKGRFDWYTGIGFCLLCALVLFITLDLDRPRRGLIQLDTSRQSIILLMDQFGKKEETK
jgi:cbb3-type cytochrome oxidase subunit 3